jgi:hypothetical protein
MNWETWQRAVELDGSSLWDVYVLGTDRGDWQRLLDWLRGSGLPLSFQGGASPGPLPQDVGEIFAGLDGGWAYTLFIDPDGMRVNTHFFIEEEIELDIGPRDVRSELELDRLQAFLTGIAKLLDRTVLVTPENGQECPWFSIAPNGSARCCFV